MKTTILLFAVILGYITPTYSQLSRHRRADATSEQFQNKKNADFGNYKIYKFIGNYTFYKFNEFLSDMERDSFNMLPTRPAPFVPFVTPSNDGFLVGYLMEKNNHVGVFYNLTKL